MKTFFAVFSAILAAVVVLFVAVMIIDTVEGDREFKRRLDACKTPECVRALIRDVR